MRAFISFIRPRFRLVALLLCCVFTTAVADAAIESIKQVRSLKAEKAAEGLPVRLEGQVVRMHPEGRGFFLFDGQSGIYIKTIKPGEPLRGIVAGDLVEVLGKTEPGELLPSIHPNSVERVGHAALPQARTFSLHELYDTRIDSDWVSVKGRLISLSVITEGVKVILLELESNGVSLIAQLSYSDNAYEYLQELKFRRVRFDAVAGSVFNNNRQLTGRVFYVNSAQDVLPIKDYTQHTELRSLAIHELMRVDTNFREVVQTEGVVSYASGDELYLRGDQGALRVVARSLPALKPGDVVKLRGLAWPQPVSPAFRALEVKVVGESPAPAPVSIELGNRIDPGLNYDLIELDAELVNVGKSFEFSSQLGGERVTLLCRSGIHLIEAHLPVGEVVADLEPGARLRLTGICELLDNPNSRWYLFIDSLTLKIRSAEDVEVLAAAPWWTPVRLFGLFGITLAVLLLALIWALVLRRTVEKQTAVIGEQIEQQTISEERQRIARELHDNLEQGLAGIAIQLRGALKLLRRNAAQADVSMRESLEMVGEDDDGLKERLAQHMEAQELGAKQSERVLTTVQGMLTHCSAESRVSILDLRGGVLERMDLPAALQAALEPLAQECEAELLVSVEGTVRQLRKVAERNLLLVAREAMTNAVRHAKPKRVVVELAYGESSLSLKIIDDGCGFVVTPAGKTGHFGMLGMHERVNRLKGMIEIDSQLNKGTTVMVKLADTLEWERT